MGCRAARFLKFLKVFLSMSPFAFVFPGQGSQAIGMLDAWGEHPEILRTVEEASDALHQDMGLLIRQGPKDLLDLTVNTQPAMLMAGVACYRAWVAETGKTPAAVAGHSLGEYTALTVAQVLSLHDALPLVRFRAQAMQDAVPVGQGTMAAILGLEASAVIQGCTEAAQVTDSCVEAVNFNSPRQIVIAGAKTGVEKACGLLKERGAKRALLLSVSAPFHSSLMKPAAEKLKEKLADIRLKSPVIPVVNNVDVSFQTEGALILDALYRQAFNPVRWVEIIQTLKNRGLHHVFECGPGKVLTGLTKQIDAELISASMSDPATLDAVKGLLAGAEA
jgi:[acyl-carrier-protein] S-malonyltransferase